MIVRFESTTAASGASCPAVGNSVPLSTVVTSAGEVSGRGPSVAPATAANRTAEGIVTPAMRTSVTTHAVLRSVLVIVFLPGLSSPAMRRSNVSVGRYHTRVTGTRTRPHDIAGRSQQPSATGGHRAAASGGSPRGDWRRDDPHIDESAPGAAMRA